MPIRLLRRKLDRISSFKSFFANIKDLSLEETIKFVLKIKRINYCNYLSVAVDGKTSCSGIAISGANKNCPFNNPFLNRSGLTLAAD